MRPWVQSPALHKPGVVEYSCNHSTGEAGRVEIQDYPLLRRELEASLSNVKPCEFNEHLLCATVRNVTINRMDTESLPVVFSPGGMRRYHRSPGHGAVADLGSAQLPN